MLAPMTETHRPVVKLTTPADLVGIVPWLVGFHPEESLVVIYLRGPRLRTGLTLRGSGTTAPPPPSSPATPTLSTTRTGASRGPRSSPPS